MNFEKGDTSDKIRQAALFAMAPWEKRLGQLRESPLHDR